MSISAVPTISSILTLHCNAFRREPAITTLD